MEVISESKAKNAEDRVSIRDIFSSNAWTEFYEENKNRIRPSVLENVKRVLSCGTGQLGHAVLRCSGCSHQKHIPFTCKSRFCSRCGKKACDNWMKNVIDWALPDIKYKHVVFTIPQELRNFLMVNRKKGLSLLFRACSKSLLYVFDKSFQCKPGIIMVMHTFGGDIKWNPHVHVIITEGGLSPDLLKWKTHRTIPEALIKKAWKYNLISELRKMAKRDLCEKNSSGIAYKNPFGKNSKSGKQKYQTFNQFLDFLYQKKWYVNLGKTLKSLEFTVRYIGRYAKRPVLAETRLLGFDAENVSFSFKDKIAKKEQIMVMKVKDFIATLIRHIAEKGQKMIRYAGLFANRIKSKMLLIVQNLLCQGQLNTVKNQTPSSTWRQMVINSTGKDPYSCEICGNLMEFVELVILLKNGNYKTISLKNAAP